MRRVLICLAFAAALLAPKMAEAQSLYSQNFETDDTANWTVNRATNVDDPQSHAANFFFDYSDVGIPKAPNSAVADGTRGMKLQNNMDFDNDGISGVPAMGVTGMSVSPNGQSFTGDYTLTFDAWGNFPGPFPVGSSGTTQMSTFGIGTSGTFANYPGSADGVWFAATHDNGSASDFRAYSQERAVSYQFPVDPAVLDGIGQPIDGHATYHATSRNGSAALYMSTFPSVSAPAAQLAEYTQQTGSTSAGSFGMTWHEVEISKIGNTIDWKVNGVSLITLDSTNFVSQPAGTNIMFGSSDINAGASADPLRFDLLFTLIDNVTVTAVVAPPTINADFNGNLVVDAADHTVWRDNFPTASGATKATGDSDNDGDVDQMDYDNWYATFGLPAPPGSGAVVNGTVPEPATMIMFILAVASSAFSRRR